MKPKPPKTCKQCGASFRLEGKVSAALWKRAKYCSRSCAGKAWSANQTEKRGSLRDKFERMFERPEHGCWEWSGTIEGYGYGVIDFNMKRYRAHVLALEFDGRPVPRGMMALHHCDNRKCVRPDHLYVGTAKDNINDASIRGRLLCGERSSRSKLTDDEVRAMRSMQGNYTEIARIFGVSRPTATRAMKRESWSHLR